MKKTRFFQTDGWTSPSIDNILNYFNYSGGTSDGEKVSRRKMGSRASYKEQLVLDYHIHEVKVVDGSWTR